MRGIDRRSVDVATTMYAMTTTVFCVVAADAERLEVHQIEATVWGTLERDAMMDLHLLALTTQISLASSTTIAMDVQCFFAHTVPSWLLVEAPFCGCAHQQPSQMDG